MAARDLGQHHPAPNSTVCYTDMYWVEIEVCNLECSICHKLQETQAFWLLVTVEPVKDYIPNAAPETIHVWVSFIIPVN